MELLSIDPLSHKTLATSEKLFYRREHSVENPEPKHKAISVNLSPAARRVIEAIRDDTGIPNTTAMERILESFAASDPKLRMAILVRDEPTKRQFARLVLQELAGVPDDAAAEDLARQFSIPAATRMIRALLDRVDRAHADLANELSDQVKLARTGEVEGDDEPISGPAPDDARPPRSPPKGPRPAAAPKGRR